MTNAAAVRGGLSDEADTAVFDDLVAGRPTVWIPGAAADDTRASIVSSTRTPALTPALIDAAEERFRWFAPLFEELFPQTRSQGGVIESPLEKVASLSRALGEEFGEDFPHELWAKRDDALAVSGSVKSRGGIHEVLEVALGAARDLGVDLDSGPLVFLDEAVRERMARMRIVVGSTGNLGMSIGLMGAILGFSVTVHMSLNAKAWKKDTLLGIRGRGRRARHGLHSGRARWPCRGGGGSTRPLHRRRELAEPLRGLRRRRQAARGSAGGGLGRGRRGPSAHGPPAVRDRRGARRDRVRTVGPSSGDAVRCVFVEPVSMPAFLLGRLTGLDDGIAVADVGLGALTVADGLAVGRPSRFVGKAVGHLLHGYATVTDDDLLRTLAVAEATAGLRLEPSACAGLRAAGRFAGAGPTEAPGTHIAWLTGGSLVPDQEYEALLEAGRRLLRDP